MRAGERGDQAFARLLDRLPDQARAQGTTLTLTEPDVSEGASYTYGAEHAISALRSVDARRATGWARVFGAGLFAKAVDVSAIGSGAGTAIVVDDNLTSTARAVARASAVLRHAALEEGAGELVAMPNVGQQVGDVIEVTDVTLGLVDAPYRVTSLHYDYVMGGRGAHAVMTLGLGEV